MARPRATLAAVLLLASGLGQAAGAASATAAAAATGAAPATAAGPVTRLPGSTGATHPVTSGPRATAGHEEDFFIVSSVDPARRRLVLKRPTEVTVVMGVTGRTVYLDQQGKALSLANLRAGDTCYILAAPDAAGELTASRVRLGAMTVEELERRYLKPSSPPQHSR